MPMTATTTTTMTASSGSIVTAVSVALAVLLAVTVVVLGRRAMLRLPPDFLLRASVRSPRAPTRLGALRAIIGIGLISVGFVLLFLPGPGLLLVVTGATLCDLLWPGRALRWLMRKAPILRRINRLRARNGYAPLVVAAVVSDNRTDDNSNVPPHNLRGNARNA